VLLIVLNRRALPEFAKLKGWRLPVMVFCAAFYILFALDLIYQSDPGAVFAGGLSRISDA
jgi:hypothetical protein